MVPCIPDAWQSCSWSISSCTRVHAFLLIYILRICFFRAFIMVRFHKKLKNVSCGYDRLNGWDSTLQAAWYIIHVRIICFLWTKPTVWSLILSFTQNIVRACSMLYHEGYRSVTPLDAARVNRRVFHNHSVHWYCITLIKGRDYIKHDMNIRHGKQNPCRGRWL